MKRTRIRHLPPLAEVQRQRKVARIKARRREKVHAATRERNRLIREDAIARGINPALVNQYVDMDDDGLFRNLKTFALILRGGNRLARKRARRKQDAANWQTLNGVDRMITSKTAYEMLYAAAWNGSGVRPDPGAASWLGDVLDAGL